MPLKVFEGHLKKTTASAGSLVWDDFHDKKPLIDVSKCFRQHGPKHGSKAVPSRKFILKIVLVFARID